MTSLKIIAVILAAIGIAMLATPKACAQTAPTQTIVLTTSTNAVAANATATVTSQAFRPNSLTGFTIMPNFNLSGTGTSNVTFNFQVSPDGTNWSTVTPFSYAIAATGTTPAVGYCNFPIQTSGSGSGNVAYVRLATVTNANTPSTLTINSITVTKSNR